MAIKEKLVMSMLIGVLGIVLVSGGTFAYFSDSVQTNNNITAGTLDLGVTNIDDEGVLFEFENKKPGDTFDYTFNLRNEGSLDIRDVTLYSEHAIRDKNGEITENDFDKQILLTSVKVDDEELIEEEMTLADLKDEDVILIEDFGSGDEDAAVYAAFEFIQTDSSQNKYQGNSMELEWTFEAMQTED
ncbi:TasA family protein [Virgibacillus kimchii]